MGKSKDSLPPKVAEYFRNDKIVPLEVREYFSKIGKKYGAAGGKTSAANMTDDQRRDRAKKAGVAGAKARWGKKP